MSNELKVALLAIAALLLSFWGYKFILGNNLLEKSNNFEVLFDSVNGVQVGTAVKIHGVSVGSVTEVTLQNDDKQQVLVELILSADYRIPKNAVAVIVPDGFMGGNNVELEYSSPCTGTDCAESGARLDGATRGLLGSMLGTEDLGEYMKEVSKALNSVVDTLNRRLLSDDSNSPLARTIRNLEGTTANLQLTTGRMDALLRRSSGAIEGNLANLNALTSELNNQKQAIGHIIANADSLSSQLVEADLRKTMAQVNETITGLQATLSSANQALGGVSTAMNKITAGEGTIGKLLGDEQLYYELKDMSASIDSLVNDLQQRPYRYVPLKGRNRVKKYDRKDAKLEGGN